MSFFSGLFSSSTPASNEPSQSQELFNSAKFDSPIQPSAAGPSSPAPRPDLPAAPTALDTFSSAYDPAKLHPLANLGDKLDFLQLDEDKLSEVQGAASVLPSRGWTDDLCVGTGTTYLSGLKEGLGRPLGDNPSMKLRINAILNGCTRRGSFMGNSLGVLGEIIPSSSLTAAIFYNIVNSSLDSYRGRHDIINAMTAGAVSGAIFKSTCRSCQ
jgi:import inner membrane translocase subunit TIM23